MVALIEIMVVLLKHPPIQCRISTSLVVVNHHKNVASFVCKSATVGNTTSANPDCWKLRSYSLF
ncbi:hypothetical protein MKW92_024299 [Papaver armeniacum]|nr:hypothetical protein MKW92_024299 [Papaver armeniacum]